ncbi:MAG: zinc-dependent alcohol dehydrogenase family protein [Salinibacter sp.]|uniref:zinc-dependent alcohol dehydrogenase family protein n=1 Tax=Salinibacter sp. TaxID=2065818 RepID=UPI0035D492C7
MNAWVIDDFGGPEVFDKRERPVPEPDDHEVLVRVHATSVNPVDYKIRRGDAAGLCPARPAVLHGDVAGIVAAVGEAVSDIAEGDAVYGCAGGFTGAPHGALADYMPCDARLLAAMPESLSAREAAALPLVTLTAWEALLDKGDVRTLQRVLVHGATGGVGHVGLQLAKWRRCEVAVTASGQHKLNLGADLGADRLIDYEDEPVDDYVHRCTDGEGFDLVFDTVAGDNLRRSVEAARLNGAVATVGAAADSVLRMAQRKGLSLHLVSMLIPMLHDFDRAHHGEILQWTADLVEEGHLRPLVDDRTFTFDEIGEAHAYAEAKKQIGKVAVTHPDA